MQHFPSSVKALYGMLLKRLSIRLDRAEAAHQAHWLMEVLFGVGRTEFVLDKPLQVTVAEMDRLEEVLQRLDAHEPLQYVLGEAYFYGRKFRVQPGVLIPRPETEELVHRIVSVHSHTESLKILDIGTGSGCIAISLALELPGSQVFALDISAAALQLARENARQLGADVQFMQANILKDDIPEPGPFDVLVSNPPYVLEREAPLMQPNVLDWEPHLALFVKNEDPLLFYRRITEQAQECLKQGGHLYFEINEAYGTAVAEMLQQAGFAAVLVRQDMQGKDRMVEGRFSPD
jgi:release factor glutamine methyltransferase